MDHVHTVSCVRGWPVGTKFRHGNILYTKTGNGPGIQDVSVTAFINGDTRKVTVTIHTGDPVTLVKLGS